MSFHVLKGWALSFACLGLCCFQLQALQIQHYDSKTPTTESNGDSYSFRSID